MLYLPIIWCKIYGDYFPAPDWDEKQIPIKAGELFNFLMSDLGILPVNDDSDEQVKGNKLIYYLCSAEKHGVLEIYQKEKLEDKWSEEPIWKLNWPSCSASPGIIINFLQKCMDLKIITESEYHILKTECTFSRDNFEIMYDIEDWCKLEDKSKWVKPNTGAMEESKKFFDSVTKTMEDQGNTVYLPGRDF